MELKVSLCGASYELEARLRGGSRAQDLLADKVVGCGGVAALPVSTDKGGREGARMDIGLEETGRG